MEAAKSRERESSTNEFGKAGDKGRSFLPVQRRGQDSTFFLLELPKIAEMGTDKLFCSDEKY